MRKLLLSAALLLGALDGDALAQKIDLTKNVTNILPKANGGTGTATPALVPGTNVTITGTWPNQTINSSAGGGGGGTGDVVGPSSAVNNQVAFFDGTTGKLIKDSRLTLTGSK